jgi:hypothetical protein
MTTFTLPCTSTTNLGKVLISTIPLCFVAPGEYLPAGGEAATAYVRDQVQPVINEAVTGPKDVALFLIFLIVMLIVLPGIVFMIWVGVRLGLPAIYILIALIFIIIILVLVGVAVYNYVSNAFTQEVQTITNGLTDIFSLGSTSINILNEAAQQYMMATVV